MISLPILLASLGCAMAFQLTSMHEWKYFEYQWDSESEKENAIASGLYNSTKVYLYDAAWHTDGQLFVTTPRTHDANPASLSTVSTERDDNGQALLRPYPSPEWHAVGNCGGITNALRFVIDRCDNLWIVDSGVIGNEVICPAQILKIDVKTDQLVMRYEIPEEVSKGGLLATSAVRTEGAKCEKIMVFAADLRGSGYVIFDGFTSWRLDKDIFEPNGFFTNFTVGDQIVNVPYGPIGFTIVEKTFAYTELGLMWSFSGNHVFGLSMHDLLRSRDSQENLEWYESEFEFPSAVTAGAISHGILFGAFVGAQKLMCVDLQKRVTMENIDVLMEDSEFPLQMTSMKTRTDEHGNHYLMIAGNNYLQWRAGITTSDAVNSGIWVVTIAELTSGTRCEPKANFVPGKSWAELGFTPLEDDNDSNL